jgi:hypothetical protein
MPDMTIPIAISGNVTLQLVPATHIPPYSAEASQAMVKITLDAPTQGQGFIELPAEYFSDALIAQLS